MELGTLQKAWVKSLRENPDRQMNSRLGKQNEVVNAEFDEPYHACCLGELKMVHCRLNNLPIVFDKDGFLRDGKDKDIKSKTYLSGSYEQFGLHSSYGKIIGEQIKHRVREKSYDSLALANDSGVTWAEIADFVEANPEKVFSKSV